MCQKRTRKAAVKTAGFLLAALLSAGSALSGCGSAASDTGEAAAEGETASQDPAEEKPGNPQKALTLMLYLCGSNLESSAGSASADLDEILSSGVSTENVNVVIMAGGTTKWHNDFADNETAVYTIVSENAPADSGPDEDKASGPEWVKKETFRAPDEDAPANMGEGDTLKEFLSYSFEEFPAQKYALIMWDHGGGPMRGLCWDTAWAKDNLTMEEFTGALAESPFSENKLEWIGFDACLMSSVETAHLVSPYARYMIASEETESKLGWNYAFLKDIENDKDSSETGKRVVDSFIEAGEKAGEEAPMTLACIDLSLTSEAGGKIDSFFSKLDTVLNEDSFSELSNMRGDSQEFGKAMHDSERMDLVDLGDLVSHYAQEAPEEAEALQEVLGRMVCYSRSSLENCCGLSTYHPYYNKTYYEKLWGKVYDTFSFAPSYTEYIHKFADIWLGGALGDWTQMSRVQSAGIADDTQYFSVQLTAEQQQYYSSGELLILRQAGSEQDALSGTAYAQVFLSDDVTLSDDGVLTAGYNGRTLYAVDDSGEVIAGPLCYGISDKGNLLIEGNYINNEGGAEHRVLHAMFECADAPAGSDLPLLERYVYDEDLGTWSNRLEIREEDYQNLNLLHDFRSPVYDGERIRPFEEWEADTWLGGYSLELPQEVHFRFFDRILDGATLVACFQISDTQSNRYGTELMPVQNPSVTKLRFRDTGAGDNNTEGGSTDDENREVFVYENELLRLTFRGQVENAQLSKSLGLEVLAENLSDKKLTAEAVDSMVLFNRTHICIPEWGGLSFYELEPGQSTVLKTKFNRRDLAGLSEVSEMSMNFSYKLSSEDETEDTADDTSEGTGNEGSFSVFLHPEELNLKGVAAEYDLSSPLAAYSRGSVTSKLMGIEKDGNNELRVIIHYTNEGKEPAGIPLCTNVSLNDVLAACTPPFELIGLESFSLDPGTDCFLTYKVRTRDFHEAFFEHVAGSEHLVISDLLRYFGVDEISSVTLIPSLYLYGMDLPDESLKEEKIRFEITDPVSLNGLQTGKSVPAGTGTGASGVGGADAGTETDSSGGQMSKALDLGETMPERTELYAQDDVTVSGEYILIADRTVLLSLVAQNRGQEDAVLRLYNNSVNGTAMEWLHIEENNIVPAGGQERFYVSFSCPDEITEDALDKWSFCIWQDGKDLPAVHEVTLAFDKGTSFNTDGGFLLPFGDADPGVVCVTDTEKETALFASAVSCPRDISQYAKTLSLKLSDILSEEERSHVKGVSAGIVRDFTEKLEEEDNIDPMVKSSDGRESLFMMPVTWISMQGAEKADKADAGKTDDLNELPDLLTARFAGLVCVPEEHPDVLIPMWENTSKDGEITYTIARDTGALFSDLLPAQPLNVYTGTPEFDLSVGLQRGRDQKWTASVTECSIDDSANDGARNLWPAAWFDSIHISNLAPWYVRSEDGYVERPSDKYFSFGAADAELPLQDGPVSLKIIPAGEYCSDLSLLYAVIFDDETIRYYEGGKLP